MMQHGVKCRLSYICDPFAVCNKMTKYRAISPFLCMDMTYITCLLKEGFGFKDNTVLQVSHQLSVGKKDVWLFEVLMDVHLFDSSPRR